MKFEAESEPKAELDSASKTDKPASVALLTLTPSEIKRRDTGDADAMGNAIYEYTATIDDTVSLDGEKSYYLSVVNKTTASPYTWAWSGSKDRTDTGYFMRVDEGLSWKANPVPQGLAFEVMGELPLSEESKPDRPVVLP